MSFRIAAFLILTFTGGAGAFTIDQPSADRWMYPFDTQPGTRPSASVFGAVGEAGFDDRDGQFLVRFDTTSTVAAGLGAGSYNISSLTLSLTVNLGDSFYYDPTQDAFQSYLAPSAPGYVADLDLGSPIELFAVGYRNGYSESTFAENSPFGTGNVMTEGARNAYAAGFDAGGAMIDVSNNVAAGFQATPLAIGQIASVSPGSLVPEGAIVTFNLDFTDPAVVAWLQASLNSGYLEFMVTSLQPTSQEAATGFPSFYTKENIFNDPSSPDPLDHVAPQLSGGVTVVPEPRTLLLLVAGGLCLAMWRRRNA